MLETLRYSGQRKFLQHKLRKVYQNTKMPKKAPNKNKVQQCVQFEHLLSTKENKNGNLRNKQLWEAMQGETLILAWNSKGMKNMRNRKKASMCLCSMFVVHRET